MRTQRTKKSAPIRRDIPLRGRRTRSNVANSLQFFATVEGVAIEDGTHIRGANGIRWRVL